MKKTGQTLKEARDAKHLSIDEVALATKISAKILQGIEEGDIHAHPQKTFLRGFVQSYAAYLKLDIAGIMQLFHDEVGTTRPKTTVSPTVSNSEATLELPTDQPETLGLPLPKQRSMTSKLLALAGFIIVFSLIIIVLKTVEKYEADSRVNLEAINQLTLKPVNPQVKDSPPHPSDLGNLPKPHEEEDKKSTPPQPVATAAKEESKIQTPNQKPEATSNVAPSAGSGPAKPDELTKTAQPTAPATSNLTPQPANTPIANSTEPTKENVAKSNTGAEPAKMAQEKPQPADQKKKDEKPKEALPQVIQGQEIILETLDNVTVEMQIDNDPPTKVNLGPDQVHTIKAKQSIRLNISDGGLVNIIYNGKDLNVPGDLGSPLSLKFPR